MHLLPHYHLDRHLTLGPLEGRRLMISMVTAPLTLLW
ncbi:hypothetical protein LINPERPRIM_LOCUS24912 [Linum perenne]